jgi:hypothetical protein
VYKIIPRDWREVAVARKNYPEMVVKQNRILVFRVCGCSSQQEKRTKESHKCAEDVMEL